MQSLPIGSSRSARPLQHPHRGFHKMQILLLACVSIAGPPTQTGETHNTATRDVNVETEKVRWA
jgi:hypothetical protein